MRVKPLSSVRQISNMAFNGVLCSNFSVLVIKQGNFGAGTCIIIEKNSEGYGGVGAYKKMRM